MLPIVKRKTLEVPHGLAAIAAAVCLVLAFATDISDSDSQQLVELEQMQAAEFVLTRAPTDNDDSMSSSDSSGRQGSDTSSAVRTSALITWFGLRR